MAPLPLARGRRVGGHDALPSPC